MYRVYMDMNDVICDLCGVDNAMPDGLLCSSCREAIARLLEIGTVPHPAECDTASATSEIADYPEKRQNTRRAGS
jgi:hypothetical protein